MHALKKHILKLTLIKSLPLFTASHTQEIRIHLEDSMHVIIGQTNSLAAPSSQTLLPPLYLSTSPSKTFNSLHYTFEASCQNQSAMMLALNHYVRL